MFPPDFQNSAQSSVLCSRMATVGASGQPNVSPKEIFAVFDDAHLVIADFAHWAAPLLALAGPRFPVRSVMAVRATAVEPIVAPSYRLYQQDTTEQAQVEAAMRRYGVRRPSA